MEILNIYKETDLDNFIKEKTGFNLNEKNLKYSDIEKNWKFLGGSFSNGSNTSMLRHGEKGLIERITNAIDAVIEKQKIVQNIAVAKTSDNIIKKAFPNFHESKNSIINGSGERLNAKDASNNVTVIVSDGSKSNKPTIDVIDRGTGLEGNRFIDTILSLNKGNKLNSDKSYLIGAFGQGGSTSLPFTYATVIVSKINGKFYYTIIKGVDLSDYKNIVYVYMTIEGIIPSVEITSNDCAEVEEFINSDSGTLVRMLEIDISKRFRDNEVTKPGMLGDYINTELFNTGLPVKITDNRKNYTENSSGQNRYAYGSYLKLQTSSYVNKQYSGTIDIVHNDRSFKVEYYMLLPKDENDWGKESKCKTVFEQFNVYQNPILYTVNGQTITTERFIKLNNSGLSFLKYRLLIIINLDILGTEKYKFFTSDRAQIIESDLTRGFLDKVISTISNIQSLREINDIIAEKSVNSTIDQELIQTISKDVKNQYNKFLKDGNLFSQPRGRHYEPSEEIFSDFIEELKITSKTTEFYKDQPIIFTVNTKAEKHVNDSAMICMYIDEKQYFDHSKTAMNGRIQYTINAGTIKPGNHKIQFMLFESGNNLESDSLNFEVLNEKTPESNIERPSKNLDLNIIPVDEASLICEVSKDMVNKKIDIKMCLDNDLLKSDVYGVYASSEEVATIKAKIIQPIALFSLFYGEKYDEIEDDESKNKLIISCVRSFLLTIKNN